MSDIELNRLFDSNEYATGEASDYEEGEMPKKEAKRICKAYARDFAIEQLNKVKESSKKSGHVINGMRFVTWKNIDQAIAALRDTNQSNE